MEVTRTIKPGEKGSQRYYEKYGERLVAVRYRKDDNGQLLTTIEVVVDRRDPPPAYRRVSMGTFLSSPDPLPAPLPLPSVEKRVALRVDYQEAELRQKVKRAGGWWNATQKCWLLDHDRVVALGLSDRVISTPDNGIQK